VCHDSAQGLGDFSDCSRDCGIRFRAPNFHLEIFGVGTFLSAASEGRGKNPLSVHAGTERSIRLGAVMWRIVGAAIALNGVVRL